MSQDPGKPGIIPPARRQLGLFEAFGVEIETMIVDADTLAVLPVCDTLMERISGAPASEAEFGDIAWSNELTLHVLEFKTNGPAATLRGLASRFHESVRRANRALESLGARLMPGAVHPWMDPATETRLWPHEYTEVYHAFDRIFGCSGHGWANLQSTHINLPFEGDEEFGRLHAAIRMVLPLIPALSAASPFLDGRRAGPLDARLVAYRGNASRVPSVAGLVVPEPAFSRIQYESEILGRIYQDLAPHDPEGVLRHEWANARGAIARFDRGTIEVRVIDAQECPTADLAVVAAVTSLVAALAIGPLADRDARFDPSTEVLAELLGRTTERGEQAIIDVPDFLRILGITRDRATAGEVWRSLLGRYPPDDSDGEWTTALETMTSEGPLARRLLARAWEGSAAVPGARKRGAGTVDRRRLREVCEELCSCLDEDRLLRLP